MRAVVQRVSRAKVTVDGELTGEIGEGILLLLAAGEDDTGEAGSGANEWMLDKVLNLRIFRDEEGKMNRSLLDVGGELLVVSQFTLYGDCRKGRRPSFVKALEPIAAQRLVDAFVEMAGRRGVRVAAGRFGAMMDVELVNDGPVTLLLDSDKTF